MESLSIELLLFLHLPLDQNDLEKLFTYVYMQILNVYNFYMIRVMCNVCNLCAFLMIVRLSCLFLVKGHIESYLFFNSFFFPKARPLTMCLGMSLYYQYYIAHIISTHATNLILDKFYLCLSHIVCHYYHDKRIERQLRHEQ